MRFARYVSLTDVIVAVMALFILWLPPRTMQVAWAVSVATSDAERYALALSEARAVADPRDGELISELSRRLDRAGFHDWSVEAAARGSVTSAGAPSQWRALLATSVAYVNRLDAAPALAYAQRALAVCDSARALDERVCPSWEQIRMDLYARHLEAGVASGIDPHKDASGFRRAGEAGLRTIRIGKDPSPPVPAPASAPTRAPAPATTPPSP
jgi:hypothetical protein